MKPPEIVKVLPYPLYATCISTVSPKPPLGSPRRTPSSGKLKMKPPIYICVCGGGGSSKTGIGNGITVFSVKNATERGIIEETTLDTEGNTAMSLSAHPTKPQIACGLCGVGRCCMILDIPDMTKAHVIPVEDDIRCVKYNKSGDRIAIAMDNGIIRVYSCVGAGKKLCEVRHSDYVIDMDFHHNGLFLAAVDCNGECIVWNSLNGALIHKVMGEKPLKNRSCRFANVNDEHALLVLQCASHQSVLAQIETENWKVVDTSVVADKRQTTMAVNDADDGVRVAFGDADGIVTIGGDESIQAHGLFVTDAAFSSVNSNSNPQALDLDFLATVSGDMTLHVSFSADSSHNHQSDLQIQSTGLTRSAGVVAILVVLIAFIFAFVVLFNIE